MGRPFNFSLCADDYAMTPGVSRGILEALDAGALTATSVMTTSPWWPESAGALRAHDGRTDIGLHLNLTMGAPLGPMPGLAPAGHLPDVGTMLRRLRARTLPLPEIAAEIDRQLGRFAAVFGRPPDHVDGHQHVHALAPIASLVLAALKRRGWTPWLRDSADRPWRILARRSELRKALGLSVLTRGFARRAQAAGFATNDGFSGYSSFDPSGSYEASFDRYLRRPGDRQLVMCHPGYVDEQLCALDPVTDTREQELRFLLSGSFADVCRRHDATPGRMTPKPQDTSADEAKGLPPPLAGEEPAPDLIRGARRADEGSS